MPDVDARLERIEQAIYSLTGVIGELVRENRALVQGLASDRAAFRETLRELSGFVATASLALERLERQVERLERQVARLAEVMEAGFAETNRQIAETNRQIAENNRLITENNRRIAENNEAIRRLLDILRRGRENGEGPPAQPPA